VTCSAWSERGRRRSPLILVALLAACGADEGVWNPDAARAVARRVGEQAEELCLVVARTVGEAPAAPMSFGLYQALVTSGFLVDTVTAAPAEGVAVLAFERSLPANAGWQITTALSRPGAPGHTRTDRVRWSVDCGGAGGCTVVDSAHVATTEAAVGAGGALRPSGC